MFFSYDYGVNANYNSFWMIPIFILVLIYSIIIMYLFISKLFKITANDHKNQTILEVSSSNINE